MLKKLLLHRKNQPAAIGRMERRMVTVGWRTVNNIRRDEFNK
jgi:hypothetical protein